MKMPTSLFLFGLGREMANRLVEVGLQERLLTKTSQDGWGMRHSRLDGLMHGILILQCARGMWKAHKPRCIQGKAPQCVSRRVSPNAVPGQVGGPGAA
jgi:hypothetical protein